MRPLKLVMPKKVPQHLKVKEVIENFEGAL